MEKIYILGASLVLMLLGLYALFRSARRHSASFLLRGRPPMRLSEFRRAAPALYTQSEESIGELRGELAQVLGIRPEQVYPNDRLFVDLVADAESVDAELLEELISRKCRETSQEPEIARDWAIYTVADYIREFAG